MNDTITQNLETLYAMLRDGKYQRANRAFAAETVLNAWIHITYLHGYIDALDKTGEKKDGEGL